MDAMRTMGVVKISMVIWLLFCAILPLNTNGAWAQNQSEKVMAVFIFKFIDYIQWPDSSMNEIRLCVYPDRKFGDLLENINTIQNHEFDIQNPVSMDQVETCQLIYIDQGPVPKAILKKPVLTISHQNNFAQSDGGMIELKEGDSKIQLIVNVRNLKQSGLIASSRLLDVAEVIR